ncbi:hypothetical protein Q1695_006802 [Nippostrongylus brasiliensis]|nr:hypothetical protein Q1695_006802 [Nippostrongylus brasiliensis]
MATGSEKTNEDDGKFCLIKGTPIVTKKASYTVQGLVGEGSFGAVYKVTEKDESRLFAMKCEAKASKSLPKLDVEKDILIQIGGRKHFTTLIDYGENKAFRYIIMELLGKNLSDLKKEQPASVFSMSTGLKASQQCLMACRELHSIGYIHRDVKPANYAIGLNQNRKMIYLLDFGISRRYGIGPGESTRQVVFKGTLPYASTSCHRCDELGPRDDCESWFYMLVDLISPMGLPWSMARDADAVLAMKENVMRGKVGMFLCGVKCKKILLKISRYLKKLTCHDKVDYALLLKIVDEAAQRCKCNLEAPFDWEPDTVIANSPMLKTPSSKSPMKSSSLSRESTSSNNDSTLRNPLASTQSIVVSQQQ